MALLLSAAATAANGSGRRDPNLVVYLHYGSADPKIIATGEQLASRTLRSAGVIVAWRLGTPSDHGSAEVVDALLTETAPQDLSPRVLAFATLGVQTGTRIEIFYDRVQSAGPPAEVPSILALVLAHEITHILEGVNRHSEYGVMKAFWQQADLRNLGESLQLAPQDIELLREWTTRHNGMLLRRTARVPSSLSETLPAAAAFSWWPF